MKTSYGRSAARLLLCLLAMVPVAVNAAVTASLSLGVLTISLGAASDVAVVDVVAGNVVVRDGAAVQKASIAMASLTGLTLTGNGLAGQAVILNGTLTLPGAVTVSAVESITHNANYTAGSYSIVANRNIATFGEIHTTAGGVTMQANLAGTGSGNFYGISLQGTPMISSPSPPGAATAALTTTPWCFSSAPRCRPTVTEASTSTARAVAAARKASASSFPIQARWSRRIPAASSSKAMAAPRPAEIPASGCSKTPSSLPRAAWSW